MHCLLQRFANLMTCKLTNYVKYTTSQTQSSSSLFYKVMQAATIYVGLQKRFKMQMYNQWKLYHQIDPPFVTFRVPRYYHKIRLFTDRLVRRIMLYSTLTIPFMRRSQKKNERNKSNSSEIEHRMEHSTNIASQGRIHNTWLIGKHWQTFSLVFKCDPKCLSSIAPLVELSGHYCSIKSIKSIKSSRKKSVKKCRLLQRQRRKLPKTLQVPLAQGIVVSSANSLSW